MSDKTLETPWSDALRVGRGFELGEVDQRATPLFDGNKRDGYRELAELQERIKFRQRQLFAEANEGGRRSLLLCIQGMDTAGKGGIVKHVMQGVDPAGVRYRSFVAPNEVEREHNFLWRIEAALPRAGRIGVFDRTHYEDVLVVRVRNLVPEEVWSARYDQINEWEARLAETGTKMIKVMLNISYDEQRSRLADRLDREDKHWKFNPHDIDDRELWPEFMEAYQVALTRCSTDAAPWYVVPADRKWYGRLAVANLMIEALDGMGLEWPSVDFNIDEQRQRLEAT